MANQEQDRTSGIPLVESKEQVLPGLLVAKFGTNSLCSREKLDQKVFEDYARQIVELQKQGVQVVVVSSGAIQSGKERARGRGISLEDKQALASYGQSWLMERWDSAIRKAGGVGAAQILVTFTNLSSEKERKSIISTTRGLLTQGFIPVFNENDPVSDQEISSWDKGVSENDRLASIIARTIGADAVLFLTDEKGIYTADPNINPQAKRFAQIPARTGNWDTELGGIFRENLRGTNQGMRAKWIAASSCAKEGARVAVAGLEKDVILRFAQNQPVGTRIGKEAILYPIDS